MSPISKDKFKFKRHELIGAEGAEEDQDFLFDCFVDTGDLNVLADTKRSNRIVVGRTGTGKTALLMMLKQKEDHVSWIEPDELSLRYLSNSPIIKWLSDNGVELEIFYRMLWRHIFAVELIQLKYNIKNEKDQDNFLQRIIARYLGDRKKREAYDYLKKWGENFWKETEYRIHELTKKLEDSVKAELGVDSNFFKAGIKGKENITEEERFEIVHRAQEIVNRVQIQKLSKVIDALAEDEFTDKQKKYFIIIDRLDENWVEDRIRYQLIRALIEAVRHLKKVSTAKIIVAIRKDLLLRVFRLTRDTGFQEEKYHSLFLPLYWEKDKLVSILNMRLNKLVRRQYMKKNIVWTDIFTKRVGKKNTDDYIIERTMFRPRDIIHFTNCCIKHATNRSMITAKMIRSAESEYSDARFRSIGDEWIGDYSCLLDGLNFFKGKPKTMLISEIDDDEMDSLATALLTQDYPKECLLRTLCQNYFDSNISIQDFKRLFMKISYQVGVIGIKKKNKPLNFSFRETNILKEAEITLNDRIEICPMFYRVFGIG